MDGSEAVRSDMQVVPEPETVQETASSDTDRLIDAPCVLAEGLVKYGNKQARGAIVKEPPSSSWNIMRYTVAPTLSQLPQ
ncbi:TPA: hypothetical protein ACH3X1_016188 [Trebouxia sp. C0004]